ncbi:hypothetical protein OG339_48395 (plasmid) [Streptosporangium sp. NBC_01495]|uniref:hypothetical protein n=1 Tax=Streptosporangium sp. NBC_01495 TaxID=2903899 RepID=UPI002E354ED8|nr:hypothetical protein [Streptosporangium sp. NBC_01495]
MTDIIGIVRGLLITPDINGGQLVDVGYTAFGSYWECQFPTELLIPLLTPDGDLPVDPDRVRVTTLRSANRRGESGLAVAWVSHSLATANRVASQLGAWYSFEFATREELPIRGNALFLSCDDLQRATDVVADTIDKAAEVAGYDKQGYLSRWPNYETRRRPRKSDRVLIAGKLRDVVQASPDGRQLRWRDPDHHDIKDLAFRPTSGWTVLPKGPA